MFMRLFIYRIKVLLQNRSLLFWSFAFPVVLGLLFNLAFSGLDAIDVLKTTDVGIVTDGQIQAAEFETIIKEIKQDGKPVFQPIEMTKKKAEQQLADGKISGFYELNDQAISLSVSQSGVEQTLLKEFLNQYLQNTDKAMTLMATGAVSEQELLAALANNENHVKERSSSGNYSIKSFYFFTLVAMTVMYGFMWGIRNANDQQANQSPNGIRLCLIPRNKLLVAVTNMLASFVLFYVQLLLILAIYRFGYQVDFGDRWGHILLVCAIGAFTSLSFGTLIGNAFTKLTFQQKISIGISISMAMSFFAGMMGSQELKYWIDVHVPILGKINIVNLISESLYQLFYYQSITPFYTNLIWLAGFGMVFIFINYFFERKVQYDHL